MFYSTMQPPSGVMPTKIVSAHSKQTDQNKGTPGKECRTVDDMWHAGLPAKHEKYIASVWGWPPNIDWEATATAIGLKSQKEARLTDGHKI